MLRQLRDTISRPSLEDLMVTATHTSLNMATTAVSDFHFHTCEVSGKSDDAGKTYRGPSERSLETEWYILLLEAVPFSLLPENRSIRFCCRCCCQAMLLLCFFVLHCCCCISIGCESIISFATKYLVPVRTSTSECGIPAGVCISIGGVSTCWIESPSTSASNIC